MATPVRSEWRKLEGSEKNSAFPVKIIRQIEAASLFLPLLERFVFFSLRDPNTKVAFFHVFVSTSFFPISSLVYSQN